MASTLMSRTGRVELDAPWRWLAAGWHDMARVPQVSLLYGGGIAATSWALVLLLLTVDRLILFLPLAAAFVFIGPMLAVGLYEASRRLQAGLPVGVFQVAFVRTRSPAQLAFLGLVLALFLLAWVRIATLIYALFFGGALPPVAKFIPMLLYSMDGAAFLVIGTAVGAALAFTAFAISVVSVPYLMTRDSDAITAIIVSLRTVADNFWPLMIWAWVVAALTAFGIATLFFGLVITFPLLGHATWHAFRELVPDDPR